MPSPHSLYGLRVILIVSPYFYMDMNCFGLVRVASSWLRVGSVAVDSFGWLRMISAGFGWFRVVWCFSSYGFCFALKKTNELWRSILYQKDSYRRNNKRNNTVSRNANLKSNIEEFQRSEVPFSVGTLMHLKEIQEGVGILQNLYMFTQTKQVSQLDIFFSVKSNC